MHLPHGHREGIPVQLIRRARSKDAWRDIVPQEGVVPHRIGTPLSNTPAFANNTGDCRRRKPPDNDAAFVQNARN
jgi:hypothetical protein